MISQDEQWLLAEKYGGEKSEAFFADCERLAAGEPLGHIIGNTPFLNCTIFLDSTPLIPRVETEYWVEKAITEIKRAAPKAPHVLDLCAGSGCIGVAVAKAIPTAHVDFGEIDAHHLPTITKNLAANKIDPEQSQTIHTDLFQNIQSRYDFILTNPPYIDPAIDRATTSVKQYEPHLALYGGRAGLELITSIVAGAPAHLTPGGQLWIEHEPEQTTAIHDLAAHHHFTVTTHPDQYNTDRYTILVLQ